MKGQQRVIVENVQPVVDGGIYPAKRTVGERVDVTASIFADGHDHVRAEVLYKYGASGAWVSVEMQPGVNDVWSASFYVPQKGSYYFVVEAWVDHLDTWFDGIKKKIAAKLDVKVELAEGGAFLKAVGKSETQLASWAEILTSATKSKEAVEIVLSQKFQAAVIAHPLRQFVNRTPKELEIRVEHSKALFSTWYELFPRSSFFLE